MPSTNGTPTKSLTEVRKELNLARAQFELKQIKAATKLIEHFDTPWGEYIDPTERWLDPDGSVWLPVGGSRDERKGGQNAPFITSEQQLAEVRTMARVIMETNPFAIGILACLEAFVIGEGYTYRATSKDDANKDLVAKTQDVIDEFIDVNEWNEMEQELFRRSRRDGEYFLTYFVGDVTEVRVIEPEYITQSPEHDGEDNWTFGIQTDSEDVQRVLAYRVSHSPNDKGDELDAAEVDHVKINVDRNIKRGMSDLYATQEGLEGARKLLRNLREGAAIQAALAGIREHKSATKAGVEGLQSEVQAYTRKRVDSGKTLSYQKIEPGTVLDVPEGLKWLNSPLFSANATNHIEILKAVLRGLAVRWGMPEYMASSDASNANYSSTLVSGSPFVRIARKWQRFYKMRFLRTIWRAVLNAAGEGGILPSNVEDLIEIQCEAPQVEIEDRLAETQIKEIEHRNRVVSKQTWRQKSGYDDEQEKVNLQQEPPPDPAQAALPFGETREDSLPWPFRLADGTRN